MNRAIPDLAEKLVSISDFSHGKAGKICSDVEDNNSEYIILKNNRPSAVIISIKEYKDAQQKIEMLEKILNKIEDMRLARLAEKRKDSPTSPFEELVKEEGLTMEELEALAESVELE